MPIAFVALVATHVRADDTATSAHLALHYYNTLDDCPTRDVIASASAAGVRPYFVWDDTAASAITVSILPEWPDKLIAVVTSTNRTQQSFHANACADLEQPVIDAVAAFVNDILAAPSPDSPAPSPPISATVTLHIRATDGRALSVERVTSTEQHSGRHSDWVEVKTAEPLCTTPCSATVPSGEALFRFTDLATQGDVQIASTNVVGDGVLDIDYASNVSLRRRIVRNSIIGGVVTAAIAGSLLALAFKGDGQSVEEYLLVPYLSLVAGSMGGAIAGVATSTEWGDKATLTVHPQ